MIPDLSSRIRRPRAVSTSYSPRQIAAAYGCPVEKFDGSGVTIGVIELGGAYNDRDMDMLGLPKANVAVVPVGGFEPTSDGPHGADGEVMLDVEVIASVAPGAKQRVYFAANTDQGFLDASRQACQECDYVSISWGAAESAWDESVVREYAAVFAEARARGVTVFCASGDTGSRDSTSSDVVDYPASDPSVVGCGGTRLTLNDDGSRQSEVTWDDNDLTSATGGGVSGYFPGRQVPDVAGNASPATGYQVIVDGRPAVVGGTSAVAPLYAAACAVLKQASGNKPFDLLNLLLTNPTALYDVTVGDNGSYRAGPGRDMTTGLGVADFGKLLTILTSGTQIPAPGGNPTPTPPDPDRALVAAIDQWGRTKHRSASDVRLAKALAAWRTAKHL